MKQNLTIADFKNAAKEFCQNESTYHNNDLYGITDGKAVGTYIEHKFQEFLAKNFSYICGSSAHGIDLPEKSINTDIKVTSIKQPQSSCPYKDAKQKVFGLGYNLLVFVYNKQDIELEKTAILDFISCFFIDDRNTADYTLTKRLKAMKSDGANQEDIIAYLMDRNIPADEITLNEIAKRILNQDLQQGYLTISNALQWRLQYGRIVRSEEQLIGIDKLVSKI